SAVACLRTGGHSPVQTACRRRTTPSGRGRRRRYGHAYGLVRRTHPPGLAEAVALAVVDFDIDARDALAVAPRADNGAAGGVLDLAVAADMVAVMVRVQDMGDLPVAPLGLCQHGAGHGGAGEGPRAPVRSR